MIIWEIRICNAKSGNFLISQKLNSFYNDKHPDSTDHLSYNDLPERSHQEMKSNVEFPWSL